MLNILLLNGNIVLYFKNDKYVLKYAKLKFKMQSINFCNTFYIHFDWWTWSIFLLPWHGYVIHMCLHVCLCSCTLRPEVNDRCPLVLSSLFLWPGISLNINSLVHLSWTISGQWAVVVKHSAYPYCTQLFSKGP